MGRPYLLARVTSPATASATRTCATGIGELWLAPGTGGGHFGGGVNLGTGWNMCDQFAGRGDVTGDGKADIYTYDPIDTSVWVHNGNGTGGFTGTKTKIVTDGSTATAWSRPATPMPTASPICGAQPGPPHLDGLAVRERLASTAPPRLSGGRRSTNAAPISTATPPDLPAVARQRHQDRAGQQPQRHHRHLCHDEGRPATTSGAARCGAKTRSSNQTDTDLHPRLGWPDVLHPGQEPAADHRRARGTP